MSWDLFVMGVMCGEQLGGTVQLDTSSSSRVLRSIVNSYNISTACELEGSFQNDVLCYDCMIFN